MKLLTRVVLISLIALLFLVWAFFFLNTIGAQERPCEPLIVTGDGMVTVDWPCAQRLAQYGHPLSPATEMALTLLRMRAAAK